MKGGLFNNIIILDNHVIKISRRDSEISRQIMEEMNSKSPDEYAKDINALGIKTPRIFSSFECSDYDILIQEFIDGQTIQSILNDKSVNNIEKIKAFDKLIDIYKKSEANDNLCLDWNMKNFILKDGEIYYVDLTPSLYKEKIRQSDSENLKQYKESYLDKNIQLAGILGYAIMPFLEYETKEDASIIFSKFNQILKEKLDFVLDLTNMKHVYLYKLSQIIDFLSSSLSYEDMKNNISSYSMEEISKKEQNNSFRKLKKGDFYGNK